MLRRKVILPISFLIAGTAFAVVMVMPKTFSNDQVKKRQRKQASEEFVRELKSIKTQMPEEVSSKSTKWELMVDGSNTESLVACDSLVKLWDKAMYPQVAAYFYAKKAEKLNTTEEWTIAGKRFLAVSAFSGEGNRGWALDNAQYAFEKALELDANNIEAKVKLAASVVEAGQDPMKGIGMLREIVAENPTNVEALMELGRFAMVSGQTDKAIGHFQEVVKIEPDIIEAKFYLADAYAAAGKGDSAKYYLDQYLLKVPNDIIAQQAREYMKLTYGLD